MPQPQQNPNAPQSISPTPYTPAGPPEPQIFEQFAGIATSTTRPGVSDEQMAWCDGFMPIGPRYLRTLPGIGPQLFAPIGASIAFFDFANIGATAIAILVFTDGSLYQCDTSTGALTLMAGPGTIQTPSRLNVGIAQYGSQYVLIVANQTNGYFIWDGATFYSPGGAAPVTGTMPTGIGGTAVETYAGRVWIASNASISYSAPGSLNDFTSGNGGGSFSSTDSFLRVRFTGLRQTNGFLYLIADSSINYISGVQTSGSPPITTFTNQNADPEVGTPWPSTITVYNRSIIFANPFGAQVSYGAAVTKISDDLDGVYNTVANFGNFVPSSAKAIIYGKKVWMLLLPIVDPVSGQQVNKIFMWNGKKQWWSSPQDVPLTYIQFQEINSLLTAWGTDGNTIYRLFQQPSTRFTKTVQSKLWDKPGSYMLTKATTRLWGLFQYFSTLASTLRISIDNETSAANNTIAAGPVESVWLTAALLPATWLTAALTDATWFASGVGITVLEPEAVAQNGVLSGITLQTESADMAVISMAIQNQIGDYRG